VKQKEINLNKENMQVHTEPAKLSLQKCTSSKQKR